MPDRRESNSLFTGSSPGVIKLAVYSIATIALMIADHHGSYVSSVRQTLGLAIDPMLRAVSWPAKAFTQAQRGLESRQALLERNAELERQWLLAAARLTQLEALESENARLRELLQSQAKLSQKVLIAEFLRVDLDPFNHRVVLNKGAGDGVFVGQPLTDADGVVGQIETVSHHNAYAMLISDANHALPVVVNRTGLRSVAYGTGSTEQLQLRDITSSADVQIGDLVVTSGLGGRFPIGVPVGVVSQIDIDPGSAFNQVVITPSARLDRSREVLLVWPDEVTATGLAELDAEEADQ